jgi:SAM-dependent methyltransferase
MSKLNDYMKKLSDEERKHATYTPIVHNGEVLYEGNRKHENQFRFDYIDVKDKKVVDLGCNNGYSSFIFGEKGAKKVLGIEKEPFIYGVAKILKEMKGYDNVDFHNGKYQEYFESNEEFDVAVFTSEGGYDSVHIVLSSLTPGLQRYQIRAKTWYIEPTNHIDVDGNRSEEQIKEWGMSELSQYGEVEFLTHTDYQNRGLFRLEIKEELYK